MINCWVQLCIQKTKCAPRTCTDQNVNPDVNSRSNSNQGIHSANVLMRNLIDPDDIRFSNGESIIYRDAGVRIIVEDPYGIQSARSIKPEAHSPNTIGKLNFCFVWIKNLVNLNFQIYRIRN